MFMEHFSKMSQRDAIRFFQEKGLGADVIQEYLVEVFGPLIVSYSSVTRTIKQTSWTIPKRKATFQGAEFQIFV
jgi:hypothetical protein